MTSDPAYDEREYRRAVFEAEAIRSSTDSSFSTVAMPLATSPDTTYPANQTAREGERVYRSRDAPAPSLRSGFWP